MVKETLRSDVESGTSSADACCHAKLVILAGTPIVIDPAKPGVAGLFHGTVYRCSREIDSASLFEKGFRDPDPVHGRRQSVSTVRHSTREQAGILLRSLRPSETACRTVLTAILYRTKHGIEH